jgi:hypothetical protein
MQRAHGHWRWSIPPPAWEILSVARKPWRRIRPHSPRIGRARVVCFLHRRFRCRHRDRHAWRMLPEIVMGKYVFAWLLGVPFALLALIYVLAHI